MIHFDKISIDFNQHKIFSNFSLEIKEGEKLLLSAPSGKGKSTLMKALLGFQKLNAGRIIVDKEVLAKESLQSIRSKIAYVSQDVELGQKTCKTLFEEVFTFKINKGLKINLDDVAQLGKDFGLAQDFLDKNISQLSGGERQRLGFIICILLKRPIWILDEITSGLDKDLKEKVVNYVLKGNETVIITSHDDIWLTYSAVKVVKW